MSLFSGYLVILEIKQHCPLIIVKLILCSILSYSLRYLVSFSMPTMSRSRYFVVFVSDIYLLKHKSGLLDVYITFTNMVKAQYSKTIKIFRTVTLVSLPSFNKQNHYARLQCWYFLTKDVLSGSFDIFLIHWALLLSASCPEKFWLKATYCCLHHQCTPY